MLSTLGLSFVSEILEHRGSRKLGLVSSLRSVPALRFFEFNPLLNSLPTGSYSWFAVSVNDCITLPALWIETLTSSLYPIHLSSFLFFKKYLFIYLVALGISCGRRVP